MPCLTSPPNLSTQLLASAVRDLAPPGELASTQTYPFDFHNVEMQYDSYRGLQVRLRYASRLAWQSKAVHWSELECTCSMLQAWREGGGSIKSGQLSVHAVNGSE